MNKIVSLEYLNDYEIESLKIAIENSIQRLGTKSKLKPNSTVLIKVCLPESVSQDLAETTNPAVVRVLVDILSQMNIKCIVADCPNKKFNDDYLSSVYLNTGMLEIANLTRCELNHNLKTCKIEVPNGVKTKSFRVLDIVHKVDAIINVGKLKFDDHLGYIGSTANMFSLMPGNVRTLIMNRLSTLGDLNEYIIDMFEAIKDKVVLNILDGIVSLEAGKTQRMLNCLAMSECSYCLDAVVLDMLNIKYDNTI